MSELRELGDISLPFALDEKKNYIYIKDAYKDRDYYCPCCGKKVNTIAINEDKEYQMPPHYRHYPHQSCSGESLVHWVYKMWLFDKESHFYVYDGSNKTEYIVKSIDIEKTYQTDYGDYRPDITITTTCDKVFFFELNFSNPKRSDDYFCKWSQLNNDVIEVDVKKLLKESLNNKIPTFRLIYSDGVCFDDKYNKRDVFANAANKLLVRKLEIQRQDMLNCKAIWEKLDWFFDSIKMFKAMKSTMDDVLSSFSNVPYEEMELCFDIIKRISCINNNQGFRDIINQNFSVYINNLINKYNEMANKMAIFSIEKDAYYKTVWNINCETIKGAGIMMNSIHKINTDLIWKKHHFPYSFYLEFENTIVKYNGLLLKHINIVNRINQCIYESVSKEDYEIVKSNNACIRYNSGLLDSDDCIEKYKNDALCCIRDRIYHESKRKIDDTINLFNINNDNYMYEYCVYTNDEKQITSIVFTLYSTIYNNILCKKIRICSNKMGNEDVIKFLKSSPRGRLKMLNGYSVNIEVKNMINSDFAMILSHIRKEIRLKCNYLFLDYNCPDIYTVKFRISVRINHGYVWNKDYKYYCGKYIELKNNMMYGININTLKEYSLEDFVIDKLLESKNIAIEKFNKLDGLYSESRFIIKKEDKVNA